MFSPLTSSTPHPTPPPHTSYVRRTTGPSRKIEIIIEKREASADAREHDVNRYKAVNSPNKENRKVPVDRTAKPSSVPPRKASRNFSPARKLSMNQQQSLNARLCKPFRKVPGQV